MGSAEARLPFWLNRADGERWPQYTWAIEELARAEWHTDAAEISGIDLAILTNAYVYRKKWEAELIAVQIVNKLGQAMGGKKGHNGRVSQPKHVSASEMFNAAGQEIR